MRLLFNFIIAFFLLTTIIFARDGSYIQFEDKHPINSDDIDGLAILLDGSNSDDTIGDMEFFKNFFMYIEKRQRELIVSISMLTMQGWRI